jgi:hypothetical protein
MSQENVEFVEGLFAGTQAMDKQALLAALDQWDEYELEVERVVDCGERCAKGRRPARLTAGGGIEPPPPGPKPGVLPLDDPAPTGQIIRRSSEAAKVG